MCLWSKAYILREHLISHLILYLARFLFIFVMTLFGDRGTLGRATLGKTPLSHFISLYTLGMAPSFLHTHRWACGPGLDSVFYPLDTALRMDTSPNQSQWVSSPRLWCHPIHEVTREGNESLELLAAT